MRQTRGIGCLLSHILEFKGLFWQHFQRNPCLPLSWGQNVQICISFWSRSDLVLGADHRFNFFEPNTGNSAKAANSRIWGSLCTESAANARIWGPPCTECAANSRVWGPPCTESTANSRIRGTPCTESAANSRIWGTPCTENAANSRIWGVSLHWKCCKFQDLVAWYCKFPRFGGSSAWKQCEYRPFCYKLWGQGFRRQLRPCTRTLHRQISKPGIPKAGFWSHRFWRQEFPKQGPLLHTPLPSLHKHTQLYNPSLFNFPISLFRRVSRFIVS